MNFLKKLAIILLAIAIGAVLTWLGLWAANIFNFILSLPIGVLGLVLSQAQGVIGFVYAFISFGLAFGAAFYFAQCVLTMENSIFMTETPWMTRLIVICFAALMIFTIDGRLDPFVPQFLLDGIEFLRTECGVYLLAPIDWMEALSEGSSLDARDYNVFNTAICLGGGLSLFYNFYDNRQDLT